MKNKIVKQQSEVEVNCKRLIRQYRDHTQAASRVKAEITTYANNHNVKESDLIQWFIDEGYTWSSAYSITKDIIKVVRDATPKVKKGLVEGLTTFKEARESVTAPTKTVAEKELTIWFRDLRNSIKRAISNGVDRETFIKEVNRIFDFYASKDE